ncbi:MAG: hypothetical protein IJ251_03090 [Oscillospiraceae bacterium]|nr:hypothetical protein [Oscillospiraceae bacterium]
MSMKLSRRDRIIFIVGIVLIILVVGAVLVIRPKYTEAQETAARLTEKENERKSVEERINQLPTLKQQLNDDVDAVVGLQDRFLSEDEYQESYQMDMYLMDLFEGESEADATGIEVTSIATADVQGADLEHYVIQTQTAVYDLKAYSDIAHQLPDYFYYAYENNWPAPPASKKVAVSQLTVGYRTELENWQGVYDLIDRIANDEKTIYLDTISAHYTDLEALTATEETNPDGTPANGEEMYIEGEAVITVYELEYMKKEDVDKIKAEVPEPAAEEAVE